MYLGLKIGITQIYRNTRSGVGSLAIPNGADQAIAYNTAFQPTYAVDESTTGDARAQQPGRAYNFDGTNDYIDTGTDLGLASTDPVTLTAWIYSETPQINNSALLISGGNGGDQDGLTVGTSEYASTNTNLRIVNATNEKAYVNGAEVTNNSNGNFNAGEWVFIAVSGNVTNVDGGNHTIGAADNSTNEFKGKIHDLRVYNSILSASEIVEVMERTYTTTDPVLWYKCEEGDGTTAYDSSGNGNDGTITNATLSTFHYEGGDVPYSYANEVGYSDERNLFADTEFDGGVTGSPGTFPASFDQRFWTTWTFNMTFADDYWEIEQTELSRVVLGLDVSATSGDQYTVSADVYIVTEGSGNRISTFIGAGRSTFSEDAYYLNGVEVLSTQALPVGEWVRVSAKCTAGSTATGMLAFGIVPSTQSGWTVRFRRPQLEKGTDITEYQQNLTTTYTAEGVYIPRNESTPTQDVLGNTIDYSGRVPRNVVFNDSNCATFDGTNDYVDYGTIDVTSWSGVYFHGRFNTSSSSIQRMLSILHSGIDDLRVWMNSGIVYFTLDDGTPTQVQTVSTYNDGQWHEVTASLIDGTMTLTVDDEVLTGSGSFSFGSADGKAYVGANASGGSGYFNGSLCDIAFGETEAGLYSQLPLAEGAGTTCYDVSGNDNHGTATSITEASFWGTTQDVYHYNLLNVFEHYDDDATGNTVLRVPYRIDGTAITPTISGYTKNSDNPAVIGHNNAETTWDFTGGVATPWATANPVPTAYAFGDTLVPPMYKTEDSSVKESQFYYDSIYTDVQFDSATTSSSTAGATHTFSHTCSGNNRLLLVPCASLNNGQFDAITGVTYNGVAMTRLATTVVGSFNWVIYLYYLIAPDTGTNNVVVTRNTGTGQTWGAACSYSDVAQVSPIEASALGAGASPPATTTLTGFTAGSWMFTTAANVDGNFTASTNSTYRGSATSILAMFDTNTGTASPTTMVQSYTGTRAWASIACSILPNSLS